MQENRGIHTHTQVTHTHTHKQLFSVVTFCSYLLELPPASQVRSAFATAFATACSNATSCPYPMPIVRALTVSSRQRSVGCPLANQLNQLDLLLLQRKRLQQSCFLLFLSTRRNVISLIYRSSAALGRPCFTHAMLYTHPWMELVF